MRDLSGKCSWTLCSCYSCEDMGGVSAIHAPGRPERQIGMLGMSRYSTGSTNEKYRWPAECGCMPVGLTRRSMCGVGSRIARAVKAGFRCLTARWRCRGRRWKLRILTQNAACVANADETSLRSVLTSTIVICQAVFKAATSLEASLNSENCRIRRWQIDEKIGVKR